MDSQNNQNVLDNVGTNPLIVPAQKQKSVLFPVLISVVLSIVVVGGGLAYTLKQYPDFYSSIGLLEDASDKQDQNSNEDLDYGQPVDDVESKDEVKWVTYENKTAGVKFKLPSNYVVSFDEIQEDEVNPYSYSITVATAVGDLKEKNPAKLFDIVNLTSNKRALYTYDDKPGKLPDWAPSKITVGGKSYSGEAYSMGEGFYGSMAGDSSVRYAIRSDFYAYIVSPFFSETPMCTEIDGNEECFTAESDYKVSKIDLENAKKIIESIEFIK